MITTQRESIQELFGRAAGRYAGRVAVARGPSAVTYGELEERSNKLANYLLDAGVPKGAVVAILAADTINVVTAIIGILRAGCAFAPFDPRIPEKRFESMIGQIAPRWFVVEREHVGSVAKVAHAGGQGVKVVCLDGACDRGDFAGRGVEVQDYAAYRNTSKPASRSEPDDLCSVFFTSGSTGVPKGIAGRLKGIAHFVEWEAGVLGVGEGTRVSQLASPSFDGFLKDVFVPLHVGGTACAPADRDLLLDARALVEWIDAERINVLHCVPSLFRSILNEGPGAHLFPELRHVVLAGEPLHPSDVGRWTGIFGERVQLVNLYGPTETTVTKLFYFVQPGDQDRRSIPIGKPMPGAKAVVVDAKGRACPPGAVGEIYIRTPYRAHGYFNRPDLTAEVFVRNPFSDDPLDIVYKTGDYGRLQEDGNFEFVTRIDQQVKIRGVRVELGEIENLLLAHPAVEDVAVVDRDDSTGTKYLCAYVVFKKRVEPAELKQHLARSLPASMMPSSFVALDALPRTMNGKIDRLALPEPGAQRLAPTAGRAAARTPAEELIAGIWSEVLGVERVGVDEDFFALGGHSLLATQVMSRVRAALGAEVALRRLFESPTVAGLAAAAEAARRKGALAPPAIERVSRERELPLSFAQQRLWFLDQLEPGGTFYNIPMAVKLTGRLDVAALERAVNEVARRHEALRTTFASHGSRASQVVSPALTLPLALTDLGALPEGERGAAAAAAVREFSNRPFDLARGPLLRVGLLRLGDEEHVVVLTTHHIVSDAWSMGLLVHELVTLYEAFSKGEPSPLAELPVQYADYAVWQREWLQGDVLERQLSYWRRQLADAPSVLDFPKDRPRRATRSFSGARLPVDIPDELVAELKTLSRREAATLFMTMLAAFATTLHRHAQQDDLLIGTPIVSRQQVEVENLIGFFINTLVLRAQLSGDPTFRELLKRVREVCLGAYAHQDVPFERLVEELKPERSLTHNPLFQASFTLDQFPLRTVELPGLTLSPVELDHGTAQFDLVLHLVDVGGRITGSLQYRTELFDAATMRDFAAQYETVLRHVVARPDARLSEIEGALDAEEGRRREEEEVEVAAVSLQKLRKVRRQTVSAPGVESGGQR